MQKVSAVSLVSFVRPVMVRSQHRNSHRSCFLLQIRSVIQLSLSSCFVPLFQCPAMLTPYACSLFRLATRLHLSSEQVHCRNSKLRCNVLDFGTQYVALWLRYCIILTRFLQKYHHVTNYKLQHCTSLHVMLHCAALRASLHTYTAPPYLAHHL